MTTKHFSLLPPHFCEEGGAIFSEEQWNEYLPGYVDYYPESFRRVVPYLVAQLCYHHVFLQENLSQDHPLRNTRIWRSGALVQLLPRLRGGLLPEPTHMKPTGIPPHVVIAAEVSELKAEVSVLKALLLERLEEITAGLPTTLRNMLLEHFHINGAIPFTLADAQAMNNNMLAMVQQSITTALQNFNLTNNNHLLLPPQNPAPPATAGGVVVGNNGGGDGNERGQYPVYQWGNRFRLVPEGFEFPR